MGLAGYDDSKWNIAVSRLRQPFLDNASPLNRVRRGLVRGGWDWKRSTVREHTGVSSEEQERRCGLRIAHARLPADENTHI
jgi:hypothetical protein